MPAADPESRREQLTRAPKSDSADADARVETHKKGDVTRVEVRDDATVRPGTPARED
ncbi:hypothetical protein WDJ51_14495 [Rathayibacter sp. YIM 133350]|uniref:hypothetical protein n=1 Tax=Rathayibacter sp. YIM 133350 TaxID=3131992 RepID=UPI00307EEFFD